MKVFFLDDDDFGANGEVIYGFSLQTETLYGHLFGIDQQSGELYIKGQLDHEDTPIYNLMVTAQDLGPDSLPADATVVIHIKDVNDNAPEIIINTLSDSATDEAEISEDSPIGTFVAHVTVKDPDGGQNGQFNCSLNDNSFTLVRRYETEYQITTARVLDRENNHHYSLALVCKDGGSEPQISIKHLQVSVADVNDNTPIFNQSTYPTTLIENSYIGAFIVQVNASDKDTGDNADIVYSILGPETSFFMVSSSGRITARSSIDHEEHEQFQFYVQASDQGTPPETGTALVVVTIEDVNDEAPEFKDTFYSFSVDENQPGGERVGTVTAEDRDSPPYNSFLYTFVPGKGTSDAFIMDPSTGNIVTKKSLDRETQSVYYLVAIATDQNMPTLTSTTSVTIYVMDTNDHDPYFEYPTTYNNTVHFSNKVEKGYIVTRVTARDEDIAQNALIQYTLKGRNHKGAFTIDPKLGTVSVEADSLQHIDYKRYELTVVAQDQGQPPRTAMASLNLVVNKSIPLDTQSEAALLTGSNFVIVISLSCICAIIAVILIIAILLIRRQDRSKREHKYNCRMEALKTVSAQEGGLHSLENSPVKANGSVQGGSSFVDLHQIKAEVSSIYLYSIF